MQVTQGSYSQLTHCFPTWDNILWVLAWCQEIVIMVIQRYKLPSNQSLHNFCSCCVFIDQKWNGSCTSSLHKHCKHVVLDEPCVSVRAHPGDVSTAAWGKSFGSNHCLAKLVKAKESRWSCLACRQLRSNDCQKEQSTYQEQVQEVKKNHTVSHWHQSCEVLPTW